MKPVWTIKVVRGWIVPETRFLQRWLLRRRERYVEELIFSAPAPPSTQLVRHLSAPAELYVEVPLRDSL